MGETNKDLGFWSLATDDSEAMTWASTSAWRQPFASLPLR